MADIRSSTWSTTAGDNNASPPDGWPEGQSPSSVNNCAREMMAAIKRAWNDDHPVNESAGSNSAYTLVTSASSTAYATGDMYVFRANHASVGTSTLNVNGIGARIIKKFGNQDTIADDIKANQVVQVAYEPSADVWQLLTAAFAPNLSNLSDVDLSGGAATGDALVYDGTDWVGGVAVPDPLEVSEITHPDNTGDSNIVFNSNGNTVFQGNFQNSVGSGGTLTLYEFDATRINRLVLSADSLGAVLSSTYSTSGGGAFRFFNAGFETLRISVNGQQSSVVPGGSTLYPEYKCRAWVNFDGTGTVSIREDGNVSSITDNGVGDYTVNFATAMPDANYAVIASCMMGNNTSLNDAFGVKGNDSSNSMTAPELQNETAVRLLKQISSGGDRDDPNLYVAIFR